MNIPSILPDLSDELLAQVTRKLLSPEGKIIVDEDTVAFLYQRDSQRKPRIIVMDSDYDFMELKSSREANIDKFEVISAEKLQELEPEALKAVDPDMAQELADDLDGPGM